MRATDASLRSLNFIPMVSYMTLTSVKELSIKANDRRIMPILRRLVCEPTGMARNEIRISTMSPGENTSGLVGTYL